MSEPRPRWEIILTRQAEKMLYRLSKSLLQRIDQALLALTENPRPPDSHPLAGYDNLYRLPVEEWRIAYIVEDERLVVLILEIAPKQQPERYPLEEESSEDLSPERFQQARIIDPLMTYLSSPIPGQFGVKFGSVEELIRSRGSSLLKRIRQRKIRFLIVDHLPDSREYLEALVSSQSDWEVVGTATRGEEAIQKATELHPDMILIDTSLPGINGITATEIISKQVPSAQIIIMSFHADFLRQAMMAGAREFLIKPFSSDELMTSIRRVYQAAALQTRQAAALHSSLRDAFKALKERLQAKLAAEVDWAMDISHPDKMRQTIQGRFEQILTQENIILSRSERERLFKDIVAEILDEPQKRTLAQWFKFYKLGPNIEISLSVADLSKSLSFYDKLGLEKVDGGETPYPWAVVSDGQFHLGLHQREFSSPTLSYFGLGILSERMTYLPKLGVRLDNIQKVEPIQGMQHSELRYRVKFMTAEFESPEGQRVFLADLASDVETTPAGRKFFSRCQQFGELSLSTEDVITAVAYWEQLGFQRVAGGDQPYPWATVSDSLIRLSLHQTPKLTKPTLTYAAPNMPEHLKRLRRRGIKFVAEHKDEKGRRVGAVIESPDGQLFFLFTGEVKP